MLKNRFDLPISTSSSEVVDIIDRFLFAMLTFSKKANIIYTAVALDPGCAIVNAYAASLYLFVGSRDALVAAQPHLAAANQYKEQATEYEKLVIEAIIAWAKRDLAKAIAIHQTIARQFPRDLLSVQMCQFHAANTGNSKGLLDVAEQVFPTNSDNPFAYAMLAFGLEENDRLEEAETWGRRATDLHRVHPWAHHAVAHVLETQGRLEDGIAWMSSVSDTWDVCGSSFYTHLWWHKALFHLDLEDNAEVLRLYDQQVWGGAQKTFARDLIHSISLLIRLELRGINIGDRWLQMLPYLQARINEHAIPFWDLHFIYAMMRAGREDWALEMLQDLQAYASTESASIRSIWQGTTLPAARGLIAHAKGDWSTAVQEIESVRDRLYLVGGSHAQRDLFEQIYLDALLHTASAQKAMDLLHTRAKTRRNIPAIQRAIASISSGTSTLSG